MDEYISKQAAIWAIMGEPGEAHYPSWYADKIRCLVPKDIEASCQRELEAERQKVRLLEELRKVRSEREYFRSRAAFFAVEAGANGKVINVEGYKAFRGTMRICPRGSEPYELCGNWLYEPDTGCWYGNGRSFPKEVCTILESMATVS